MLLPVLHLLEGKCLQPTANKDTKEGFWPDTYIRMSSVSKDFLKELFICWSPKLTDKALS